jgi:hypothetical protein
MELPGWGVYPGHWDLRGRVDAYLGNVDVRNKRVLEIGTANGFLCFEMEKRGAQVVAYDLSENDVWDLVPFGGQVNPEEVHTTQEIIRRINNAWWFAHRVLQSQARMVYGTVYNVPEQIGPVDIATFGSVLLHLRDPFLALQRVGQLTQETIIVTDLIWPLTLRPSQVDQMPEIAFYPDPDRDLMDQSQTWWHLSPSLVSRFLKILGFPNIRVSYHQQKYPGPNNGPAQELPLYTVVGQR